MGQRRQPDRLQPGGKGWVAINNGGGAVTRTFATGLPAGTYANVAGGGSLTVDGSGNATVTVPAKSAMAVHTGATGPTPTTVQITFENTATTTWGTSVYLVGSIDALKNWNTAQAVLLSSASYPVWRTTVTLPTNTYFEYKFIKKDGSGNVTWESGANRTHTTGTSPATISTTWK